MYVVAYSEDKQYLSSFGALPPSCRRDTSLGQFESALVQDIYPVGSPNHACMGETIYIACNGYILCSIFNIIN